MAPAHKLLATFGSSTVLGMMLARLEASTVDDILVLIGHDAARVSAVVTQAASRATVLMTTRHGCGLSATLADGLARVPPQAAGVLVCLADMPLVRTETIDRLLAAFRAATNERPVVAPFHDGCRGNPVLWHRAHLPALARLNGDEGGRLLLRKRASDLVKLHTDDRGVLIDIDTQAALAGARALLAASP